eukprot:7380194-Prymnesium_polylepis.1
MLAAVAALAVVRPHSTSAPEDPRQTPRTSASRALSNPTSGGGLRRFPAGVRVRCRLPFWRVRVPGGDQCGGNRARERSWRVPSDHPRLVCAAGKHWLPSHPLDPRRRRARHPSEPAVSDDLLGGGGRRAGLFWRWRDHSAAARLFERLGRLLRRCGGVCLRFHVPRRRHRLRRRARPESASRPVWPRRQPVRRLPAGRSGRDKCPAARGVPPCTDSARIGHEQHPDQRALPGHVRERRRANRSLRAAFAIATSPSAGRAADRGSLPGCHGGVRLARFLPQPCAARVRRRPARQLVGRRRSFRRQRCPGVPGDCRDVASRPRCRKGVLFRRGGRGRRPDQPALPDDVRERGRA